MSEVEQKYNFLNKRVKLRFMYINKLDIRVCL